MKLTLSCSSETSRRARRARKCGPGRQQLEQPSAPPVAALPVEHLLGLLSRVVHRDSRLVTFILVVLAPKPKSQQLRVDGHPGHDALDVLPNDWRPPPDPAQLFPTDAPVAVRLLPRVHPPRGRRPPPAVAPTGRHATLHLARLAQSQWEPQPPRERVRYRLGLASSALTWRERRCCRGVSRAGRSAHSHRGCPVCFLAEGGPGALRFVSPCCVL